MQEKRGSVEGDKKHENLDKKLQNPRQLFYQPLTVRMWFRIFAGNGRRRLRAFPAPTATAGKAPGRRRTAPPEPGAAGAYRDENVEPLNFDDYGDFKADLC